MARRPIVLVLLAAAVVGGAGGYGVGELTAPDRTGAEDPGSSISKIGSSDPVPVKTAVPDRTKALRSADLRYKAQQFVATRAVKSRVKVEVPKSWAFTQPEADEGRYTDPEHKRWIRVEAGFTPIQSPVAAMAQRIRDLGNVDPMQDLRIVDKRSGWVDHVDGQKVAYSTLSYTYIPQTVRRHVMVRWISFGTADRAAVEISITGLPQDSEALLRVLQRATVTVERSDGTG